MKKTSDMIGRPVGAFSQQFPGTPTEQADAFVAHGLDCVQWQPGIDALVSNDAAQTADFLTQWNHTWVAGTTFEKIPHVILYDFSIHWFDIVTCLFRGRACESVSAYNVITPGQTITAPMAANSIDQETLTVVGTKGLLHGFGPAAAIQQLTLTTAAGVTEIPTPGVWFPDGFRGAMGELLSAIEDNREPTNGARGNLDSLALCFAAMKSVDTGLPQVPALL